MSVRKTGSKLLLSSFLILVQASTALGSSNEPLKVIPTSAVSCKNGDCRANIDESKSGIQSYQSGAAPNFIKTNYNSELDETSLDDLFAAIIDYRGKLTQQEINNDTTPVDQATPQIAQSASGERKDEITIEDQIKSTSQIPVLKSADDPVGDYLKTQNSQNQSKDQQPTFEIGLPMLMDERYLGDVTVRVMGDVIAIDGASMLRLLKPDLTEQAIREFEALISDKFLVIDEVEIDGLDISYDPALQQVDVRTPIDSRQRRVLRLGSAPLDRNVTLETPGNVSLFVTPIISTLYNWDDTANGDKGFQPIRGSLNFGGRFFGEKGIGFLSRQSFSGGNNGNFRRNETTVFYDRLDKLLRVSAGDLRPRGLGFQSTPRIAGLSIERFFNLEPNQLFRPTASSSFELERPSTVDIRLNGVTRREVVLQPGRYNIDDLPLVQGSNLVDLVIRDDLGQERIISDQSFFDFGLLEPGIADYSLAIGVKASTTNTGVDYSDDLAATGFYRRGINRHFTVGFDAQGDKTGANGGISTLLATALGVFRAEASVSDYKDAGSGYAGELGYRYLGGSQKDWLFSFTGNARYFSENFATLRSTDNTSIDIGQIGQDVVFDPVFSDNSSRPFSVLLNGSARLRKGRIALSATASHNIGRGENSDRTNIIGGLTYQLNNRMSLGTFGRHSKFEGLSETSATVQLNYRFGRGSTLRANYDTDLNELDVQYNKAAANGVGSLSYNVSTRGNFDTDSRGISAGAFYTGNRFEANLDHSLINQGDTGSNDFEQFSQASLSSSLVFVDGAFGIGRPVQSTFAILQPHDSLKGRKILINPTETGYNASSDFLGAAVASEGQAFSTRSTYFDVDDLPIGYDLGEGQYSTRAPLYAGYKITVGSGASFTLMGQLKNKETGEPLPNYGGRLEPIDNPSAEAIPAFTNRNGRLAASGIKPGRYRLIIFNDPSFEKIITIRENSEPLIQLGDIEVTVK